MPVAIPILFRPALSALAVACLLAACTRPEARTPAAGERAAATVADAAVFRDAATGLSLHAVPGMALHRDFQRDYLTSDGWKAFAPEGSQGRSLVALVLDGSNDVAAAELRIGASDDMAEVARCLDPPAEAEGDADQVEIGGVAFAHFRAADAAMSHFVQVDGYRSVRNRQCVAIDLMVSGTRAEVYDPPRQPPFVPEEAQQQLRNALGAVHWDD